MAGRGCCPRTAEQPGRARARRAPCVGDLLSQDWGVRPSEAILKNEGRCEYFLGLFTYLLIRCPSLPAMRRSVWVTCGSPALKAELTYPHPRPPLSQVPSPHVAAGQACASSWYRFRSSWAPPLLALQTPGQARPTSPYGSLEGIGEGHSVLKARPGKTGLVTYLGPTAHLPGLSSSVLPSPPSGD